MPTRVITLPLCDCFGVVFILDLGSTGMHTLICLQVLASFASNNERSLHAASLARFHLFLSDTGPISVKDGFCH